MEVGVNGTGAAVGVLLALAALARLKQSIFLTVVAVINAMAHVVVTEGLMDQVSEGILDIAVLYAPQHRLGLKVELLMKEKLVLVTTAKGKKESPAGDYVYVDWGPDFAAQHNLTYPERANPGTYVGLGPLGLLAGGARPGLRRDTLLVALGGLVSQALREQIVAGVATSHTVNCASRTQARNVLH